jgi:hypothetical protein
MRVYNKIQMIMDYSSKLLPCKKNCPDLMSPHCKIHKHTYMSPDGKTLHDVQADGR